MSAAVWYRTDWLERRFPDLARMRDEMEAATPRPRRAILDDGPYIHPPPPVYGIHVTEYDRHRSWAGQVTSNRGQW